MNIDTIKPEFMLRLIPKVTTYRKNIEMNFYNYFFARVYYFYFMWDYIINMYIIVNEFYI